MFVPFFFFSVCVHFVRGRKEPPEGVEVTESDQELEKQGRGDGRPTCDLGRKQLTCVFGYRVMRVIRVRRVIRVIRVEFL